jgi:hypothetical protein
MKWFQRFRRVLVALAASGVLAAALSIAPAARASTGVPSGWIAAGMAPHDYDMGADQALAHGGKASGFIRAKAAKPAGFGTLMQMCKADRYRGQRVRMSAWVKSESIPGWAGVWMRVDGEDGKMLAFDNMQSRPIKGTTAWTRHAVVLDVAANAKNLAFGILLDGTGAAWIDEVRFEVVDKSVATTGVPAGQEFAAEPTNLDFEK